MTVLNPWETAITEFMSDEVKGINKDLGEIGGDIKGIELDFENLNKEIDKVLNSIFLVLINEINPINFRGPGYKVKAKIRKSAISAYKKLIKDKKFEEKYKLEEEDIKNFMTKVREILGPDYAKKVENKKEEVLCIIA
nr:hypothetical protein [Candidatus Gracilibacteria bacterium]